MLTPTVRPIVDGRVVSFDPVVAHVTVSAHSHKDAGHHGLCARCQQNAASRLRQQNEDAANARRRWIDTVH